MFPLVSEAIGKIRSIEGLRYIAFSHFDANECGSFNDFVAAAPKAVPVCSRVAALASVDGVADRPARPLADGESLKLGRHEVRWHGSAWRGDGSALLPSLAQALGASRPMPSGSQTAAGH
jgi:flavorubredoxin